MANNGARACAVANQCFVANAATTGVGQPIVVDEAIATAMHWTRCINNIEAIGGLNRHDTMSGNTYEGQEDGSGR